MKTIFKTIIILFVLLVLMVSCILQAKTITLSAEQEAYVRGQICESEKVIANQRMMWRQNYDMPKKQMQGWDKTTQQRQITNYAYTFEIGETVLKQLATIKEFQEEVYNWCMTRD